MNSITSFKSTSHYLFRGQRFWYWVINKTGFCNGSQIAFSVSTDTWNTPENIKTYEIYVMNADGSSVRRLTNNNSYDGYPRWSPDGILFAFSSDRTGYQLWEVFIMDISGANVRRVTHSPVGITAINPVWRPGISD